MKIVKPHFWYNKSQRNGAFLLLAVIVVIQLIYVFVDFSNEGKSFDKNDTKQIQARIDSLKKLTLEKRKPKIYPFNPNYLSEYKAEQLGLSLVEIDRLIAYRKQGKFVNSAKEFQKITGITDSLLIEISPYFKFPDWLAKKTSKSVKKMPDIKKESLSTTDLNMATIADFEKINDINEFLAKRIVKYREKLQGFSATSQLQEIWGIDQEKAIKILHVLSIKTAPKIVKINVNTASFKQLLSNPYIDYNLCKKILDYRDEVAELQSIEELKNIQGFPIDKYDRIVLYLEAN